MLLVASSMSELAAAEAVLSKEPGSFSIETSEGEVCARKETAIFPRLVSFKMQNKLN